MRKIYYCAFITTLCTAMRQGELLGLRIVDLNFETRTIHIRQQLLKGGENPVFIAPKTDSSYRIIQMTQLVYDVLKMLLEEREKTKEIAEEVGQWQEFGLVFVQQNGRPLYPNSLTRCHLKTVLKKAKLPTNIRFHDLRGSTATLPYELGEDSWSIASICGHAAAKTAHDHYIHKQVQHQDRAMLKIDELFKDKMKKTF